MKHKTKHTILLIIFISSFFASLFLSQGYACNKYGICEVDNTPEFIPDKATNGYIGVFIFLLMSILTYSHLENPTKRKRHLINYGTIIGSLVAVYFLYIQFTLLEYYCNYCMIIDIGMVIGLLLVVFAWKL